MSSYALRFMRIDERISAWNRTLYVAYVDNCICQKTHICGLCFMRSGIFGRKTLFVAPFHLFLAHIGPLQVHFSHIITYADNWSAYDSFSDVPESWVWWRADFQCGSRMLKKVFWTFSYLYLWLQCGFMQKSCWKHSNFENRSIRYVNLAPDLRNHQKKPKKRITQSRFTQIFE